MGNTNLFPKRLFVKIIGVLVFHCSSYLSLSKKLGNETRIRCCGLHSNRFVIDCFLKKCARRNKLNILFKIKDLSTKKLQDNTRKKIYRDT